MITGMIDPPRGNAGVHARAAPLSNVPTVASGPTKGEMGEITRRPGDNKQICPEGRVLVRLGSCAHTKRRSGRVGSGQVKSGQVRSGQVRSGQVRSDSRADSESRGTSMGPYEC
jgi:hypothetical protein